MLAPTQKATSKRHRAKKGLPQRALIQTFIDRTSRTVRLPEVPDRETAQNDLAKASTRFSEAHIATESLARILARQGKYQQALTIYETLSLKFPDKHAYFASLSKDLKNKETNHA